MLSLKYLSRQNILEQSPAFTRTCQPGAGVWMIPAEKKPNRLE